MNRRGAERAFCDRRKRDLRQFDLRHVAPRQWFFRRCSLACSGRASARVCARLGGCRGQLAHTARSAARCIYPRGSQSVRKQKQQRRFRAVKRAIAERTTPAFYAKRLTASARPLDTFAANVSGSRWVSCFELVRRRGGDAADRASEPPRPTSARFLRVRCPQRSRAAVRYAQCNIERPCDRTTAALWILAVGTRHFKVHPA